MQNVLVPVDFSSDSLNALQHACELARPFRASLHLLHVVESTVLVPPQVGTASPQARPEEFLRDAEGRLQALVEQWGGRIVTTQVCVGEAAQCIVDCCRAREVDLIVMGTHGTSQHSRKLMGRTAEKVVRMADSPVLTVRHRSPDPDGDEGEVPEEQ